MTKEQQELVNNIKNLISIQPFLWDKTSGLQNTDKVFLKSE